VTETVRVKGLGWDWVKEMVTEMVKVREKEKATVWVKVMETG
jgi:hypothetical protein